MIFLTVALALLLGGAFAAGVAVALIAVAAVGVGLALLIGGALAVLILGVLVTPYIAFPLGRLHRPGQRYDAIIVLGNKVMPDGSPGHTMRSRVRRGVDLLKEGAAPRVVMTGGAVHNQYVEAETMAAFALSIGAPLGSLVLETEARNTRENARYTAELMRRHGWRTALVVTSTYHARRSRWNFVQEGIEHRVEAVPVPKELGWKKRLRFALQEHYVLIKMAVKRLLRMG